MGLPAGTIGLKRQVSAFASLCAVMLVSILTLPLEYITLRSKERTRRLTASRPPKLPRITLAESSQHGHPQARGAT